MQFKNDQYHARCAFKSIFFSFSQNLNFSLMYFYLFSNIFNNFEKKDRYHITDHQS